MSDKDFFMERGAVLSGDGKYRYKLSRHWGDGPEATFIMLNPSTADASMDDPTIRRCVGFAERWGMSGIYVGNLFGFRATKPDDMMGAHDPVGPDNYDHLKWMCQRAAYNNGLVICAWGARGNYMEQDQTVLSWLVDWAIEPKALRLTKKSRMPEHPLYIPYEIDPVTI